MTEFARPTGEVFLNNREAAQHLKLSPRTLEKLRVNSGGPRFRKFGQRVIYSRAELEAWAAVRRFESTTAPNYPFVRRARGKRGSFTNESAAPDPG